MYQGNPTKVRTGSVRLSYLFVNAPRPADSDDGEPKYSATLLIPKTDTATKAEIDAAIKAAADKATPKTWGGVRPPKPAVPIHDCDDGRQDGTPFGPECAGCWILTASSKYKPTVVHWSNTKVELDPQDVYSGMYASVMLNFFGYNFKGKKGVGCELGNICKIKDGEPLGFTRSTAEEDFSDFEQITVDPITGEPIF